MSVYLAPTFGVGWQGFTTAGLPLNVGKLYTYIAGGTTPQATYTTYLGNVQNANPIILGTDGRPPNEIWLTGGVSYRFDLKDSLGNLIKTYDNVSASSFVFTADLASTTLGSAGATLVGVNRGDGVADTLENILDSYSFLRGNQTPVAGADMKIDLLRESSTFPLKSLGSMWAGSTYTYAGISKEFTVSDGAASSPCTALFAYASNNNSNADVVGVLSVAKAQTTNDVVFGGNFIATSKTGITTPKLVGMEIDVEPAAGVTAASGSGGLYINAFNTAIPGPAIQTGGASSGTFSNGIQIGGLASTAAGVAPTASAAMDSLINTGSGVYTTAALKLTNTHRVMFLGTASAHAYAYNDSSNVLRLVPGSAGMAIRNNADTNSNLSFGDTGIVSLISTGTINWDSNQSAATANTGAATLPANPVGFIKVQVAGVTVKLPYYAN